MEQMSLFTRVRWFHLRWLVNCCRSIEAYKRQEVIEWV